jgi:hypothetical protein
MGGPQMRAKREPTYEELKQQFFKKLYSDYYFRPPDAVVLIPVSGKIAEAVRMNPESVRIGVRGVDGVQIVEGPRRNPAGVAVKVGETKECDGDGFPIWYEECEANLKLRAEQKAREERDAKSKQ